MMFITRFGMHLLPASLVILCSCAFLEAQDNPPRFEIGAVESSVKPIANVSGDLHPGGGARLTVNATPYIAGEVESTHQPVAQSQFGGETHTFIALEGNL